LAKPGWSETWLICVKPDVGAPEAWTPTLEAYAGAPIDATSTATKAAITALLGTLIPFR
jgi:hypothetical protein